jgi:TPR repeat protein
VTPDCRVGADWFQKAADKGLARAQLSLGQLYDSGQGVPRDPIEAYKWYRLAAGHFSDSETEFRGMAVERSSIVAAKMTPDEISKAKKLASEWTPH